MRDPQPPTRRGGKAPPSPTHTKKGPGEPRWLLGAGRGQWPPGCIAGHGAWQQPKGSEFHPGRGERNERFHLPPLLPTSRANRSRREKQREAEPPTRAPTKGRRRNGGDEVRAGLCKPWDHSTGIGGGGGAEAAVRVVLLALHPPPPTLPSLKVPRHFQTFSKEKILNKKATKEGSEGHCSFSLPDSHREEKNKGKKKRKLQK